MKAKKRNEILLKVAKLWKKVQSLKPREKSFEIKGDGQKVAAILLWCMEQANEWGGGQLYTKLIFGSDWTEEHNTCSSAMNDPYILLHTLHHCTCTIFWYFSLLASFHTLLYSKLPPTKQFAADNNANIKPLRKEKYKELVNCSENCSG